jgi:hypothetical protein
LRWNGSAKPVSPMTLGNAGLIDLAQRERAFILHA